MCRSCPPGLTVPVSPRGSCASFQLAVVVGMIVSCRNRRSLWTPMRRVRRAPCDWRSL
nr:MAG TPA: hypothetical protein [Caudoviricetes sp.]